MEKFSKYLKLKSPKNSNCTTMGHLNAKTLVYSETLYKTESLPKKFDSMMP